MLLGVFEASGVGGIYFGSSGLALHIALAVQSAFPSYYTRRIRGLTTCVTHSVGTIETTQSKLTIQLSAARPRLI